MPDAWSNSGEAAWIVEEVRLTKESGWTTGQESIGRAGGAAIRPGTAPLDMNRSAARPRAIRGLGATAAGALCKEGP